MFNTWNYTSPIVRFMRLIFNCYNIVIILWSSLFLFFSRCVFHFLYEVVSWCMFIYILQASKYRDLISVYRVSYYGWKKDVSEENITEESLSLFENRIKMKPHLWQVRTLLQSQINLIQCFFALCSFSSLLFWPLSVFVKSFDNVGIKIKYFFFKLLLYYNKQKTFHTSVNQPDQNLY